MAETAANMVLTLAFLKLQSIHCLKQIGQMPAGISRDACLDRLAAGGRVVMDEDCTFAALCRGEPEHAGTTVKNVLQYLTELQPHGVLDGVFQPERFATWGQYHHTIGNPTKLSAMLASLAEVRWDDALLSLACGNAFANAICKRHPPQKQTNRDLADLMARLLDPQPGESVLDPACGYGLALLACAQVLAERHPAASLRLHGMEHNPDRWSLAKMLMLLADYPQASILPMALLKPGILQLGQRQAALADMVLTIVPEEGRNAPVTQVPSYHKSRAKPLPLDGRTPLVWQARKSMKKKARMALLLPSNGLDSADQLTLNQHLLESNLLEAVITIPPNGFAMQAEKSLLLLLRGARKQREVAFISPDEDRGMGDTRYDADAILLALQAFREEAQHPALRVLPPMEIASRKYQLDCVSTQPGRNRPTTPDNTRVPTSSGSSA